MILNVLEEFESLNVDYATSCKPFYNWVFDENNNPINHIDYSSLNTKNIVGLKQMAHCFHIFNKEGFLSTGQMLQPGHALIEVPHEATIDVDTREEYEYAKWRWENLRS
jgi:CMP-N-acetylneuraminic acid synthetase